MSNKEFRTAEVKEKTSKFDIPCSIFCGSLLIKLLKSTTLTLAHPLRGKGRRLEISSQLTVLKGPYRIAWGFNPSFDARNLETISCGWSKLTTNN